MLHGLVGDPEPEAVVHRDVEGATKLVTVEVTGGRNGLEAKQAARAIAYACAHATDMARGSEAGDRPHWQDRANLLTPIAKAWSTDLGVEPSADDRLAPGATPETLKTAKGMSGSSFALFIVRIISSRVRSKSSFM